MAIRVVEVSGGACVRALLRAGFTIKLANESGTALSRDGRVVLVPHTEELSEATLRLIVFAAKMTLAELTTLIEAELPKHTVSGVRLRTQVGEKEPPIFSRPYVHEKRR